MTEFDVVVVGTGGAGTSAAEACAAAGRRVAIVDERPYGGTCPLRGCDPKKILVGAAELVDWARRMRGAGIGGTVEINWAELMRFKHTFTDPVPAERESALRAAGVVTYHGPARFCGATSLEVGGERLTASHIVIATGARPAPLRLLGEELLITSTEFLDLASLPKRIAFIGGGYIAFEFAHVAVRAGAAPVILQRGPRVLAGFEPSLVDAVVEVSRRIGIDVRTGVAVSSVEEAQGGLRVRAASNGEEFAVECDVAVHAAGRIADLDDLALEAGNVERTPKGVAVNEFLQSRSNPAVYAAGDCADGGGLPLTPTAAAEGELAAKNLLEGNRNTLDFAGLASIVYTIPSLGMTGLTRARARARALRFTVHEGDSTLWYSSRRIRTEASLYQLLVEDGTGAILGAHVLGPHTEELINIFSLAIRAKIAASTLNEALFAYPTASSDIFSMLQ
ncbi:MAG TPA: NAD(P)/FAD-dependent oxidoreductase [Candidatus Nitrosotalea sp.]|nr:NAD(P)/FAD-dependent oxidoreductase [Candidatus Nitrosotalea sp.]